MLPPISETMSPPPHPIISIVFEEDDNFDYDIFFTCAFTYDVFIFWPFV